MTIAIMQPYFLPYIGYFQLMNYVDIFVVYDNIQYSKGGWINRNRILSGGKDVFITLPLKKDSDYLDIRERYLSDSFHSEKNKILRKIEAAYRRAPYFEQVFPLLNEAFSFQNVNLFSFIMNSLLLIKNYLQISTKIIISSSIEMNHSLKNEERVIAICKAMGADRYVNPIGGKTLYSKEKFSHAGVTLNFMKTMDFEYKQFNNDFIPFLSIIDIMMFNSVCTISRMHTFYETI